MIRPPTTSCSMSFSTKTQALLSLHFFFPTIWLYLLNRHIKLQENICAFHQPAGNPCDFSTAWQRIHGILNFKRFCIIWSKLSFSCSLQRHWKRPLFPSLHPLSISHFLFEQTGVLSMNHDLHPPCSELCLLIVKQREWWKWQRRHLPRTTALTESERRWEGGRGEEGAVPDGRNTQQGNKLAETITYSDRPGGAALLAGRRVGPGHGPSRPRWMGLSLRTKLILGV